MRGQRGYTYVLLMVLLAIVAGAAALTLQVADTQARRSAEAELLGVGREFERAFASYYRQSPVGARRFPDRLEDLVRDPRLPGVRRHLRRIYTDPLGGGDWGLVPAPGGGVMAVYSQAAGTPFRQSPGVLAMAAPASAAAGAASAPAYADWRFGYDPARDARGRDAIIRPTPVPRP